MKTLSFSLLFVLLLAGFDVAAQTADQQEINPSDPAFRKKYENVDFKGKFSVQVLKDKDNNYFLVDFSQFKDKYERVYFMQLAFKEGKIVNIDGDIMQNKVWFLSYAENPVDDINKLFQDLKDRTLKNSLALSKEQKEKWLLENDKYK